MPPAPRYQACPMIEMQVRGVRLHSSDYTPLRVPMEDRVDVDFRDEVH